MMRMRTWVILWCLIVAGGASPAQTIEANAATIQVGLVRGFPGETVAVPISLVHTGAVSAVQFDLDYPAARMTASVLRSAPLPAGVVLRSRPVGPARYRFLIYHDRAGLFSTNVNLGSLPFSLPPGQLAGGGQIRVTNELVAARNGVRSEPIRLLHGAVLVGPVFRGPDGVVDVFLTVAAERAYVLQATTDFASWVNLSTNYASVDYIIHKDIEAGVYPMRFYRAVPLEEAGGLIEALAVHAGGFVTLGYPTVPGRDYVLQSSTNLVDWASVSTNTASGGLSVFTNFLDPAYSERFFRVAEQP